MPRWLKAVLMAVWIVPLAALGGDYGVWVLRGRPAQQVQVEVFTVMSLKGQKEDFGEPEQQLRTCADRLFCTRTMPACSYLLNHREIVLRP